MNFDFYTSDLHFSHKNIIKYCDRPFRDIHEMNEALIQNYNSVVKENDNVLFVGDVFFCPHDSMIREKMTRLNGNKYLVIGNHDKSPNKMLDFGFKWVEKEIVIQINNRTCRVNHYPYAKVEEDVYPEIKFKDKYSHLRPKYIEGEILIHGHTHSKYKVFENSINVGVDCWDMFPASKEQIEDLVKNIK